MHHAQSRRRMHSVALLAAASSLAVTACTTETGQGAVGGAAVGAIAGALIGGKKGAAIGAAAGAALGAATGAYLQKRREEYATLEEMAREEIRIADNRNMQLASENQQLQNELSSLNAEIATLDANVAQTSAKKQALQAKANSLKARIAWLDALIEKTQKDIDDQQSIVTELRKNAKLAEAERLDTLLRRQRDVYLAQLRTTRADAAQTLSDMQPYI